MCIQIDSSIAPPEACSSSLRIITPPAASSTATATGAPMPPPAATSTSGTKGICASALIFTSGGLIGLPPNLYKKYVRFQMGTYK